MKTVNFDLKDADGESHTYEVVLFSVAENVKLQLMCAGPLIKAVGKLAAILAPAFKAIKPDTDGEDLNFRELLSNVDWQAAPEVLLAIPEMIEQRGGPELVTKIFARTVRLIPIPDLQGLPTVTDKTIDSNHRQELKDPNHQEHAFGDGNFREYWEAAAMVLLVNFSRYGRTGSMSLNQLLGKLTLGAWQPSPMTTETAKPTSDTRTATGPPGG